VISLQRIEEARSVIDPVFLDTPQFRSDSLSAALGAEVVLKIECLNPVRSFKGRGACYFTHLHKARPDPGSAPRPEISDRVSRTPRARMAFLSRSSLPRRPIR
jgi:threonine dehydratase